MVKDNSGFLFCNSLLLFSWVYPPMLSFQHLSDRYMKNMQTPSQNSNPFFIFIDLLDKRWRRWNIAPGVGWDIAPGSRTPPSRSKPSDSDDLPPAVQRLISGSFCQHRPIVLFFLLGLFCQYHPIVIFYLSCLFAARIRLGFCSFLAFF